MQTITPSTSSVSPVDFKGWNEHPYNLQRALERFERDYVHNILVLTAWDQSNAASMLGISRKTLETKLKKYELTPSNFTTKQSVIST